MKTALNVEIDEAFAGKGKASVSLGPPKSCFYLKIRDGVEKVAGNVLCLSDDAGLETSVCCPSEVVATLRIYTFLCGQDMEIAFGLAAIELSYAQATSSDDDRTKVRTSQNWTVQEMVYGRCDALNGVSYQASGAGNMHEHDVCWLAYQNDEIASGYGLLHASAPEGDGDVPKYCVDVDA